MKGKSAQWHAARRKGVGGSDAAAILGVDPYRDAVRVYNEKLGLVEPEPMNAAMKRGTYLEPIAAKLYSAITKRRVRTTGQIVHPTYPWMLVNIDRFQTLKGSARSPVEIKCPGVRAFTAMKHQGLPIGYVVQMQHALEVAQEQHGTFVLFNAELWELIHFDVERDPEFGKALIAAERTFWNDHVLKKVPPPPIMGGVEQLPKSVKGDTIVRNDSEWVKAAEQYQEADQLAEQAAQLIDTAKEALKGLMGGFGSVEGGGIRVHYKRANGRKTFDKDRLRAEHPEIDLARYEKQGAPYEEFRVYPAKRGIGD